MMWRRRRADANETSRRSAPDVGDECEAFLSGRFALHLLSTGQLMPSWIGLNRLAHGTIEDVIAVSSRPGGNLAVSESAQAIAYLADTVLDLVGRDAGRLQALQRDILVPAELELAADWFRRREPSEIISTVVARLDGGPNDGTTHR
jgi:hypothetical protein